MMWQVVELVAAAIGIGFLVVVEFLDWHGRFELIEKNYPRLWRAINNRLLRLVAIIVAIVFSARVFRNAIAIAPPPIVRTALPPAPMIDTVKVVENPLQLEFAKRKDLRAHTLALADDIESWYSQHWEKWMAKWKSEFQYLPVEQRNKASQSAMKLG